MAFKRYGARTDKNQSVIVKHINRLPNCRVIDLSGVAGGCPDILIQQSFPDRVRFHLVEIKTDKGKLNKKQVKFHAEHHCHIAKTVEDVWSILGLDL